MCSTVEDQRLVIVFHKPQSNALSNRVVSQFVGKVMHVDLFVMSLGKAEHGITYTAYMFERYGMSLNTKRCYSQEHYIAAYVPCTDMEMRNICAYADQLCNRNIKYNYTDAVLAMLPSSFRMENDDVVSEDPRHLTSLYCSQAAVLVLRNCLDAERSVTKILKDINSRFVLPTELLTALEPYTTPCDADGLAKGELVLASMI